jgi:hypothetical protein
MPKKPVSTSKMHAYNASSWPLNMKNKARTQPEIRGTDTIKPSHRPAAKKAAKEYLGAIKDMKAAGRNKDAEFKAATAGNRAAEFLNATGGTPTGVYRKAGEIGTGHGTWEGIYTHKGI